MPISLRGSTNSSFRLGAGNVTNPSLAFVGNPSTGLFLQNGNIGVSVNGTETMRITSSGILVNGNVTANTLIGDGSLLTSASFNTSVSNVQVANSTYTVLDDTAVSTDGGFVVVNGSGFIGGSMVLVGGTPASSTVTLSYTQLGAQVPAKAAGTYSVTVVRPDSVSVNLPLGVTYSPFPAWSTATNLGDVPPNTVFSRVLAATSDSTVTYANTTALPPQTTIASNGTLSGNITTGILGTSYSFEVKATDMENQEAFRTFSFNLTPISLISGSTYDATSLGPQTSITDLEIYSSSLPSSGYLKYTLKRSGGAGSNVTVVSYFVKNGSQLCQSIFHMDSYSLETPFAHPSYNYTNDDHDTLGMQGDGTGFLARTNTDTWAGNYDKFQGSSSLVDNGTFDQCFMHSVSSYVVSRSVILLAFPGTNTNIWLNGTLGTYKVNDFPAQTMPSAIVTLFTTNSAIQIPGNRLWHISDGINCCMIGNHNTSTAEYIEFDLNTGTIYKTNTFSITVVPNTNQTEEDSNGCQLFAVNGCWAWYETNNFYWTAKNTSTSYGWRFVSSRGSSTSNSIGSVNTQTQADIMSSVDAADKRVWFADWGHDNGGLFNFEDDNRLGIAKSSIYMLTSQFVG